MAAVARCITTKDARIEEMTHWPRCGIHAERHAATRFLPPARGYFETTEKVGRQKMKRRLFLTLIAAATATSASMIAAPVAQAADEVKIGFLVKQPEEPWFQDEWKFAEMAAKDKGFTLVKIGAPSGEKVMSAIDNLAAQKAQGFIICTPDVKLGPGIVAKAKSHNLKMMTVDDRLVDGAGKPIEAVPHMGISAYNIGKQVGEGIAAEIKKRGWDMKDVGAIDITYEQLPTAHDRTSGATDALVAAGFPKANIVAAPQ